MALRPKIERFRLWQVAPEGTGREYEMYKVLKALLKPMADFFDLGSLDLNSVDIFYQMSFADAIRALAKQMGLHALPVFVDFQRLALLVPMVARDRRLDQPVLLLPQLRGHYVRYVDTSNSQVFSEEELLDRYDEFLQIFPVHRAQDAVYDARSFQDLPVVALAFFSLLTLALMLGYFFCLSHLFSAQGNNRIILLVAAAVICGLTAIVLYLLNRLFIKNFAAGIVQSLYRLYQEIFQLSREALQTLSIGFVDRMFHDVKEGFRYRPTMRLCTWFLVTLLVMFLLVAAFFGAQALMWTSAFYGAVFLLAYGLHRAIPTARRAVQRYDDDLNAVLAGYDLSLNSLIGLAAFAPFNAKLLASVERLKKALKRQWSLDFFVRSLYLVLPAMGLFSFGFWYSQTELVLMPGALATAVVLTVMVTVAQAYICQNIDAILWSPSSISLGQDTPPSSNTHVEPVNLRGAIELVNVSFSYADASELVVKNYSAIFSAEKFYIIYGPSGVGKTTMLRLLMGDLSPIMGEVVIDGQDVRSLNQESLRKRFGVVFEAAHLFAGSVYDNILCGREQQKGNLKKLLLSHAIFDHLIDLPMGVETYIFSQGKNLSRLEYAIVLLARALVHEPIFLFMDDFLTGLGPKQQASILGYLSSLKITRILTANHELAKVHCDGIIEIGQHAITELGSSAL